MQYDSKEIHAIQVIPVIVILFGNVLINVEQSSFVVVPIRNEELSSDK